MDLKELEEIVRAGVSRFYWQYDKNCATTSLSILAEIYEIPLQSQTIDAAVALHGAGKYGAQCGLVEGAIMFIGIFGRQQKIPDSVIIDMCRGFAEKFEGRFGSLLCKMLRPSGFNEDDPPHMCEQLTCKAIEIAAVHAAALNNFRR